MAKNEKKRRPDYYGSSNDYWSYRPYPYPHQDLDYGWPGGHGHWGHHHYGHGGNIGNQQNVIIEQPSFSFAQLTSNEDGRTSASSTMGVIVTVIGCLAFLMGIIDRIFFTGSVDIMVQTIVFTGIGAGLLGIRKWKANNGVTRVSVDRRGHVHAGYGYRYGYNPYGPEGNRDHLEEQHYQRGGSDDNDYSPSDDYDSIPNEFEIFDADSPGEEDLENIENYEGRYTDD